MSPRRVRAWLQRRAHRKVVEAEEAAMFRAVSEAIAGGTSPGEVFARATAALDARSDHLEGLMAQHEEDR